MDGKFRLVDYSDGDSGSESDGQQRKTLGSQGLRSNKNVNEKSVQNKPEDQMQTTGLIRNDGDMNHDKKRDDFWKKHENNSQDQAECLQKVSSQRPMTICNREKPELLIDIEQYGNEMCNSQSFENSQSELETFCDMSDLAFVAHVVSDELSSKNGFGMNQDYNVNSTSSKTDYFLDVINHERKLETFDSDANENKGSCKSLSSSSSLSSSLESSDDEDVRNFRDVVEDHENEMVDINPPKTKDEILLEELPELLELDIVLPCDAVLEPVGSIQNLVEQLIVIKAFENIPALDMDTVLFKKDRRTFGKIFDVFGPVKSPFYAVRISKENTLQSLGLQMNEHVYYAPDLPNLTCYVFLEQLKKMKGSDASWSYDQEPPSGHKEFSDDEEERKTKAEARKMRQLQRRNCSTHDSDADSEAEDNKTVFQGLNESGYHKSRNEEKVEALEPKTRKSLGNISKPIRFDNIEMGNLCHSSSDRPYNAPQPNNQSVFISDNRSRFGPPYPPPHLSPHFLPHSPYPPPHFSLYQDRPPPVHLDYQHLPLRIPPPPLLNFSDPSLLMGVRPQPPTSLLPHAPPAISPHWRPGL